MRKKQEKRKEERFECFVPVEGKEGTSFDSTQTIDISKNGIGFISSKSVPLDKKIAVELVLNPPSDPLVVLGQVKWVRQISDSENYRVGMWFSEVLSGSSSRLVKYLSR